MPIYSDQSCIAHGTAAAAAALADIAGLFVESVTLNSARDRNVTEDANGSIVGLNYCNPTVTIAVEGKYDVATSTNTSWANIHPGIGVTPDANILAIGSRSGADFRGFDADFSSGVLVYEDPEDAYTSGEDTTMSYTLFHAPLVA